MNEEHANKKVARISDEAVRARTGKDWQERFALLDAAGARKMNHTQTAAYLYKDLRCPAWWNQMVAVVYEQERGLREKYQKPTGYEISSSETIAVPVSSLYRAWHDEKTRRRWLKHTGLIVRKTTLNKSMRIIWAHEKTSVDVNFYIKGHAKSQISVQHGKLANRAAASRMKAIWDKTLDRLKEILEA